MEDMYACHVTFSFFFFEGEGISLDGQDIALEIMCSLRHSCQILPIFILIIAGAYPGFQKGGGVGVS